MEPPADGVRLLSEEGGQVDDDGGQVDGVGDGHALAPLGQTPGVGGGQVGEAGGDVGHPVVQWRVAGRGRRP